MTRIRTALAATLGAAALAGCAPATPAPASSPAPLPLAAPAPAHLDDGHGLLAADALTALPVKGRAPKTGYSRDQFGAGWTDADGDGCDTRQAILARDAVASTLDRGMCIDGVSIVDPYSGERIDGRPAIDIDHVVALGNAWQTGAQQLDPHTREDLANDPLNLLAVSDVLNRKKSDADAATWLPPRRAYWCDYVARQIAVKARYQLWVTDAEGARMAEILHTCPGHPLPTE